MSVFATFRPVLVIAAAICLVIGLGRREASAATTLFMQCTGVEGSSASARHRGWIDLTSFELGAGGPARATITKVQDASSSRLSQIGATFASCTVELIRPGADVRAPYRTYKLAGVTVRRYDVTVATAQTTETIALNFSRIDTVDVTCDAAGRCGTPSPVPAASAAVHATATPSSAPRATAAPVFHPRLPGQPILSTPTPRPH